MPLPSSLPTPQVLGIQGPGYVPLSSIRADPAGMDTAFANGMTQADSITDHILLRPRQVAAAAATADYTRAKALSDAGMVGNEADARMNMLQAQNAQNADTTQGFKDQLEERTNPGQRGRLLNAQAVATQDDADQADRDVIEAHKQIDIATAAANAGGDPIEVEKANQQLERAVSASGKAASAAKIAKNNLLVYTANTVAAKNVAVKGAADSDVAKQIATETMDSRVQTALANDSVTAMDAMDKVQAAGQFAARDAKIRALSLAPQIAAKGVELQAAAAGVAPDPELQTTPTAVSTANENAAVAQQVTADLVAQAQLQATAAQIANGGFTGTLDPKLENELRTEAAKLGVQNLVPGTGAKRPIADVAADYAKAVNIKEAAPVLTEIRAEAAKVTGASNALKQIKALGKVDTGTIYSLPGVTQIDRVLAQWGVEGPQKREVLESANTQLVPLVRQPGQVSNYEQRTYKLALPGVGLSEKSNASLLQGLMFVADRASGKPAFYDSLTGALPVNEVNKMWDQYINANPSINDDGSFNKNALTPQQYAKLVSSAPTEVNKEVNSLAHQVDLKTAPSGSTPADFAAAPATAPFLASRNARGEPTPVRNPKFWAPIFDSNISTRKVTTPAAPTVRVDPGALLNSDPTAFLRPVGAAGPVTPVPLGALAPRGP